MRAETLDIPEDIRLFVYERDGFHCRLCGKYLGERAGIHHVLFGGGAGPGMGGRRVHDPAAMVTICWLPGDPAYRTLTCHERAHREKAKWQPPLLTAARTPGATALQLRRWSSVAT